MAPTDWRHQPAERMLTVAVLSRSTHGSYRVDKTIISQPEVAVLSRSTHGSYLFSKLNT
jgi:hypothetical protein